MIQFAACKPRTYQSANHRKNIAFSGVTVIGQRAVLAIICATSGLSACRDEIRSPSAYPIHVKGVEDEPVRGQFSPPSTDSDSQPFYVILQKPRHGRVAVDQRNAAFVYEATPDFWGTDSFTYAAIREGQMSKPAPVVVDLDGVNDPPKIQAIPKLQNSASEFLAHYPLHLRDPDGDALYVTTVIQDPSVAAVAFDEASQSLVVEPRQPGETWVSIQVTDGKLTTKADTTVSVGDVTRDTHLSKLGGSDAIVLLNRADRPVSFHLRHNKFRPFASDADVVQYVRQMPRAYPGEPFERVLWRFVRDNTLHGPPRSPDTWQNDPWVTINSMGGGLCSNVAGTYVRLARAAGYEARVWGLTGHVVPEIKIGDRWEVFDPDLAVYYYTRDGQIAGVADIVADPSLVTNPSNPVLDTVTASLPYSEFVASIYASAEDNYIGEMEFVPEMPPDRDEPKLPPGASFTYPGNWTGPASNFEAETADASTPYVQGSLEVPAGWTGSLPIPWLIADIRGQGTVRLNNHLYHVGSDELRSALRQDQRNFTSVQILDSATPLQVIMFLNAIRYAVSDENDVSLTGMDIWAIGVSRTQLPESERVPNGLEGLLKPHTVHP